MTNYYKGYAERKLRKERRKVISNDVGVKAEYITLRFYRNSDIVDCGNKRYFFKQDSIKIRAVKII